MLRDMDGGGGLLTSERADGAGQPRRAPRLLLLDGFQLECAGSLVELPLSAQRLVAFLAVHERPLLRTYVAGSLWLDKTEERSHANLRSALWRLRPPTGGLIESRGFHLRLDPAVEVDLHRANLVARSQIQGGTDVAFLPDHVRLLSSGDLLPDWYEDWVIVERERLRQLRLHALEALCDRLAVAGRFGEAVDVGLAAVAAEPLRESAHRALISAHLGEGNAIEAARQYAAYRQLLWDALAVEPSPQLKALVGGLEVDMAGARRSGRDAKVTLR